MKKLTTALKRRLQHLERRRHHQLIHRIHRTHRISYRTLFYMKEYGRRSHVAGVIMRESILALFISLVLSVFGGVTMESIRQQFVSFMPLIILLPALNDMMGDYSMILTSKLSTLAFVRNGMKKWWSSTDMKRIARSILLVAAVSALYIGVASSLVAYLKGFELGAGSIIRVVVVSAITTLVMIVLISIMAVFGVSYIYRKREDPNSIVMPVLTSVADMGTILVFALVVGVVF